MAIKKARGISHRYSKLIALASVLVVFLLATFSALWLLFSADVRSYEHKTQRTTQKINEKVIVAVGTLDSLGATHQASSKGFDHRQFSMFADNLLKNQSAISATGRYDMLLHDDLDGFTSELQLQGTFDFKPKSISENGKLTPLDNKPNYNTLVSFFPQDPVSANYIGLDLSEIVDTNKAIQKSIRNNAPVATILPSTWMAAGQVNVFSPSFYGHYVPDDIESRLSQTDGGYFITLDLVEVISQSTEAGLPLSVGISLHSKNYNNLLVNQTTDLPQKRLLPTLFRSHKIHHSLAIGNGSAEIVYTAPAGLSNTQIASAIVYGLIALTIFSILASFFLIYRASKAQFIANEKELARERARALVTLNSLQDSVITTDSEDKIDYLNPAVLSTLKVSKAELIGKPLQEVIDTHFQNESTNTLNTKISNVNSTDIGSIKRLISGNSENKTVFNCNTSAITNHKNDKIGAVLTMRDVSKEHALTTELAHLATHDALTGLPNRRKFESILSTLLGDKELRKKSYHTVAYIDLDQFKLVNDTAGHIAGDELLKKLARDLLAFVPENIEIARLGGDEFGVVCTHHKLEYTVEIANLFYDFFQSYFFRANGNLFSIRSSIGLTTIKPHHVTINDVLSEVDIACYTAKDLGRNNFVVYDAENQETKDREGEMLYLPILQSAIKNDQFTLYTQPIVSTLNQDDFICHHYECLLRLIDDNGEIITPYKFIVAAERYDLIKDIDKWVIKNAFRQIAEFKNSPLENTIFSINLSGQTATDAGMLNFIDTMLNEYKIDSSNICFELTETAVINNFTQAQKLIAFLRKRGCTIALDDFGAGASSFGYLKNLEVDYLKIDGQFVKEMTSNKVDFEMVRAMNNVGDALGIKTIAEFVEDADIMRALSEIHVDYAQGYYVGKPAPMSKLLDQAEVSPSRAA